MVLLVDFDRQFYEFDLRRQPLVRDAELMTEASDHVIDMFMKHSPRIRSQVLEEEIEVTKQLFERNPQKKTVPLYR